MLVGTTWPWCFMWIGIRGARQPRALWGERLDGSSATNIGVGRADVDHDLVILVVAEFIPKALFHSNANFG